MYRKDTMFLLEFLKICDNVDKILLPEKIIMFSMVSKEIINIINESNTSVSISSKFKLIDITKNITNLIKILPKFQNLICLKLAKNKFRKEQIKILTLELIHLNKLKELDLSYNCIGIEGVEILTEVLSKSTSLKILNISYNKLGQKEIQILLKGLTYLEDLNISGNYIGQLENSNMSLLDRIGSYPYIPNIQCFKLGIEGIYKLLDGMKILKKLDIREDIEKDEHIYDDIRKLLLKLDHIYYLNIEFDNYNLKELKIIIKVKLALEENLPELKIFDIIIKFDKFDYNYNNDVLSFKDKSELTKGLLRLNNLKNLDIGKDIIGKKRIQHIAELLLNFKSLYRINISYNNLSIVEIKILIEELKNLNKLKEINISNNSESMN